MGVLGHGWHTLAEAVELWTPLSILLWPGFHTLMGCLTSDVKIMKKICHRRVEDQNKTFLFINGLFRVFVTTMEC